MSDTGNTELLNNYFKIKSIFTPKIYKNEEKK